jgi:membrane protease YdiL (CAAX protease family)
MEPEKESTMKTIILFYFLAFSITWIIWWPMALSGVRTYAYLFITQSLGALGPLLSLFILNQLYKEKRLVKTVFDRIKLRREYARWFILSSLFPIALAIITSLVRYLAGDLSELHILQPKLVEEVGRALIIVIPIQFLASLITSPLFEEPAWRGFVVATLYQKKGTLFTSILVGTLWWVWHIPLYVTYNSLTILSFMGLLGYSFILDAFFIQSGRNLFVAMLFHQGMNTAIVFFNPQTDAPIGIVILWIFVILIRAGLHIKNRNKREYHQTGLEV